MRSFFSALALVFAVPTAWAADLYVAPAQAQAPTYSWSGPYLGAYALGGAVVDEVAIGAANVNGVGGEGIGGGVFGGYNFDVGGFILGVEAAVGLEDLQTEASFGPFALEASPDWTASVSARVGYLLAERAMLYGIGGWSYMSGYTVDIATPGPAISVSEDYSGWHIGTGIEAAIGNAITARVEYRYTQYGGEAWTVTGLDVEPSTHTGRLGIAYKF
jgi:outer membrane immunogenic protein